MPIVCAATSWKFTTSSSLKYYTVCLQQNVYLKLLAGEYSRISIYLSHPPITSAFLKLINKYTVPYKRFFFFSETTIRTRSINNIDKQINYTNT